MEKYDIEVEFSDISLEIFAKTGFSPAQPVTFEGFEYIGTLDQEVDEVLNA